MRLIRALVGFGFSFAVAWIVIFTFIQEPFKAGVPAKVFTYETPPIPMYMYVVGAFALGVFIGLCFTLYSYFGARWELWKKKRELKQHTREIESLKASNAQRPPEESAQQEADVPVAASPEDMQRERRRGEPDKQEDSDEEKNVHPLE